MPCGQRCKEIIDTGNALHQAVQCMNASILLTAHGDGDGPSKEKAAEFLRLANETAKVAQEIAQELTPSG
jgi:hypothetical protein